MADQLGGATGNATAAQLLTGYTASVASGPIAGTMPNNGQKIITPGTAQQAIAQGYHDGTGYVKGDANLVPTSILSGVSIFGVAGSVVAGRPYASGTVTSSSANATFTTSGNQSSASPYVTISGLTFTPKFIFLVMQTGALDFAIYDGYEMMGPGTNPSIALSTLNTFQLVSPAYVNATGFEIPVHSASSAYSWHAWG